MIMEAKYYKYTSIISKGTTYIKNVGKVTWCCYIQDNKEEADISKIRDYCLESEVKSTEEEFLKAWEEACDIIAKED